LFVYVFHIIAFDFIQRPVYNIFGKVCAKLRLGLITDTTEVYELYVSDNTHIHI